MKNKLNDKQEVLKPEDIHLNNVEDIKQALALLSVQERASLLLTVSGFTPEEVTEVLNTRLQHFFLPESRLRQQNTYR